MIALALRDAGAEVIYTGLRKTPDYIARVARRRGRRRRWPQRSCRAATASWSQRGASTVSEAAGVGDIPLFVGGTIPAEDAAGLLALGVKRIYTSDMSLADVVASIAKTLE